MRLAQLSFSSNIQMSYSIEAFQKKSRMIQKLRNHSFSRYAPLCAVSACAPPSLSLVRSCVHVPWESRTNFGESPNALFQCSRTGLHSFGYNTYQTVKRTYVDLSNSWKVNRTQYTKYRLTVPYDNPETTFDDIYMSSPGRDDFAKYTKEVPVFLRFLKLNCDVEKNTRKFVEFAKRCETGLTVEKDVFITKQELVDNLWSNGFTATEISAYEIAFPADYKFHYPELAVLFDLHEEDCYKFCLRARAATPETLVELRYKPPSNLVSSYGLAFLGVWYGFSSNVLSSVYFYAKTFPFIAVYYMAATKYYRQIKAYFWKEEDALVARAQEAKLCSEDFILSEMTKYTKETNCLDYMNNFLPEFSRDLRQYYGAYAKEQMQRLHRTTHDKLVAIYNAEKSIEGNLQSVIMRTLCGAVRLELERSKQLQDRIFAYSVAQLAGKSGKDVHPLIELTRNYLKKIQTVDLSKVPAVSGDDPSSFTVEQVAKAYQDLETGFERSFFVLPEEKAKLQKLKQKCVSDSGSPLQISKLSSSERAQLADLVNTIAARLGLYLPDLNELQELPLEDCDSHEAREYATAVNSALKQRLQIVAEQRYTVFLNAV